jgi:hypothetical protein
MTGTNHSNKRAAAAVLLALLAGLAPLPVAADDLILEGEERLSGKVLAITPDGTVLLDTPLAPEAVALKSESVKRVIFAVKEVKSDEAACQVTLSNGDVLAAVIGSLDDKNVTLASSLAGPLVIPRELVASLRIGVTLPHVIFSGPNGLGGWKRDPSADGEWSFDKGGLNVDGAGAISRSLDLPPQFVVRFKLAWDSTPNFKFTFAGPTASEGGPVDRYFLQFNGAGLEIKREATSGKRYTSIATFERDPDKYPGKRLTVEIRVDRAGKTLQLLLNDEPEGRFKDPMPKAPAGGGIAFESMAGEGNELNISEIQITDWDLKDDRRPVDDRGDKTKDALIGIESERFSGNLVGTKPGPEGLLYVFKSAFQENAIEVPESQVATIFLTARNEGQAVAPPSPFCLRLLGGGSLRVSACSFSETEVTATHPLLGPLTIQRDKVTAFERVSPEPKANNKKS